MRTPALFQLTTPPLNFLKKSWISLIEEATPVEKLRPQPSFNNHQHLFVKREDLTSSGYGGNKVRNLEFLLGHARSHNINHLVTTAPLGSNFVAALAAQARKVEMKVDVFHFIPHRTPQIEKHAAFSYAQGANLKLYEGPVYLSALKAFLRMQAHRFSKSYFIAPGGSSPIGVLGHISAALELADQIKAGEIPEPDYLIVGVGTCGTLAGLLAGFKIAGLRTKVIGVRCVDRIVCNPLKIKTLANQTLKLLGHQARLTLNEIDLRDNNVKLQYGKPLDEATQLSEEFYQYNQLTLDSTYTSKVTYFIQNFIRTHSVSHKRILYWHTFSPAAMNQIAVAA